jgi:hypothetical protein
VSLGSVPFILFSLKESFIPSPRLSCPQIQHSEKENAFPIVPPSFPESLLSPQHFIAVFNSSQVAPSGSDMEQPMDQPAGMLRQQGWQEMLEAAGAALSAHWPGIRGLGSGCL